MDAITASFMGINEDAFHELMRIDLVLRETERRRDGRREVVAATDLLRNSWRTTDDNAFFSPHWFFLRRYTCEAPGKIGAYEIFWPSEYVSDLAAARALRPHQIGTFADCANEKCKVCGRSAHVIGKIVHDGETPQETSWAITFFTLCGGCTTLTPIARGTKTEQPRMT